VGQRSDEIREEIERTREELSGTLDVIGDRVSPRRAARRSMSGIRGRVSSMRETVMGSPDTGRVRGSMSGVADQTRGMTGRASEAASSAAEQVREAPEAIKQQVEGNPLAAGIIAFGAGLLLGSIIPPTEREKRMAESVGEGLRPAVEQAKEAAQEMKSELQDSAQQAAEHLKEQAQGAVQDVKEQAQSATEDVKVDVTDSAQEMKDQTTGAAQETASAARQQ